MKLDGLKGLDVMTGRARAGGRRIIGSVAIDLTGVDAGKQYLTLHVVDPKGLVAKEKGAGIATLTNWAMPELVENTIYKTVAEELHKQFKEKGSDVEIEIVSTPPKGSKPTSDLRGGVIMGVLISTLTYGVIKLVGRLW